MNSRRCIPCTVLGLLVVITAATAASLAVRRLLELRQIQSDKRRSGFTR